MADSSSPAFTPPVNTVKDNDPQIIRVPTDKVDFGFRQGCAPPMQNGGMALSHVKNGQ